MAKKPQKRTKIPPRDSDNEKRILIASPTDAEVLQLKEHARYAGSSKHKRNPTRFGLLPFNGARGDETLCDEHAGLQPDDMGNIHSWMKRGIAAKLIGCRMLWTVADNGWVFEARLTNSDQHEYHGYPVRQTEAIAKVVYERFNEWAIAANDATAIAAARACAAKYGF